MLNQEYIRKIRRFMEVIPRRMYQPCREQIVFEGFVTKERLSLEEAQSREKRPFSVGETWGKKWEYGWFFTTITVPQECKGQRVVFRAELGEGLVFLNRRAYGSLDREHKMILLTEQAQGGEVFDIAMEIYAGHAGHDGIPETTNVLPCTVAVIPEENKKEFSEETEQKTVRAGEIGIFQEPVFQFWMDMRTLYELRGHFDNTSWRQAQIDKCLQQVCDTVDVEAELSEFISMTENVRKIMEPQLACKNGSSAPTMYAIGNSHLDLEWMWTKEETRRKAARTLSNQLRLLEEYDDYRYMHSQPWLLETVKQEYPALYEEIKEWIKKGRIIVEGGMWVEADTNLPTGESLIRQFLFGKRFLKEEFDVESEILWLPDVFGLSAVLPQLMNGCGVKYLLHAKIPFQYDGGDLFPYNTFLWKGLDGTGVLTHVTHDYASGSSPDCVFDKWNQNAERADVPAKLFLYGHGDGGGGATRIHQEFVRREKDLEGMPKVKMASPKEFFDFVEQDCEVQDVYRGEIYYAAHRGTYTSQAKTKRLGRKSEAALREAEMWSVLSGRDVSVVQELKPLWKEVLFNHFHDVIPGSSMTEVYTRAEESFTKVIAEAEQISACACTDMTEQIPDTLSVFHSLSWNRKELVPLPSGYCGVCDSDGRALATQTVHGQTWAMLNTPSCGATVYQLQKGEVREEESLNDKEWYLENDLIRVVFNAEGELVSVTEKENGMEYLQDCSNRFRMYQDAPTFFDAWDIDSFYEKLEVTDVTDVHIEVESRGVLFSSLLIRKRINHSEIRQRVILKKGSRRIDFETEVDWNETHRLLKVDFATTIHTDELLSEVQFGHVKRPTHRNRQHDADRFEVWQHKWSALAEGNRGVAILNDCKYGISAEEGRMSLTLLKSAAAPALHADQGTHQFTYSMMPYVGTFFESDVIREAYELNMPVQTAMGSATTGSLLEVSEGNVIIETVKYAEDESGDVILRLYESKNNQTNCKLRFGFDVKEVYMTDMLENNIRQETVCNREVSVQLKAFEILTLRLVK